MESVEVKNKAYLTITEAQAHIANKSRSWYKRKIKAGKIKASSEGRGSGFLILTESLLNYLESLQY